jgi:hypothetical protein
MVFPGSLPVLMPHCVKRFWIPCHLLNAITIDSGALTYDDTIGPLLVSRCGACHAEAGIMGLNLTTYQNTMQGSTSGPVITPGDANDSLLVQKQSGELPHFGQFTPAELSLVVDWINAEAPEK